MPKQAQDPVLSALYTSVTLEVWYTRRLDAQDISSRTTFLECNGGVPSRKVPPEGGTQQQSAQRTTRWPISQVPLPGLSYAVIAMPKDDSVRSVLSSPRRPQGHSCSGGIVYEAARTAWGKLATTAKEECEGKSRKGPPCCECRRNLVLFGRGQQGQLQQRAALLQPPCWPWKRPALSALATPPAVTAQHDSVATFIHCYTLVRADV